jgi:hypothetical protein
MSREKASVLGGILILLLFAVLMPVWLPLLLAILLPVALYKLTLYLGIWLLWLPRGKNVLFVSSNSPIWHDFMVEQVLPLVSERAAVLNWSERKSWPRWSLAVRAFYSFAGEKAFNPIVIVFRPFRFAKKFRFWPAFKCWKRGNKEPVERLRQDLFLFL